MKRLAGVVATVAAVLLCSAAARAAVIACGDVTAEQGGTATVEISLEVEGEEVIAGTQNDLEFDDAVFGIETSDCTINPAIGPDTEADKTLNTSLLPGDAAARPQSRRGARQHQSDSGRRPLHLRLPRRD